MPLIPETWLASQIVNTTASGQQSQPDIAQLANGNILVTWTSAHDTGDGSPAGTEVFGQLFDPLGAPIGTEFRINQASTVDNERDSDIVALPDGGFLVIYHDDDFDGLGGSNIRMERFDAAGAGVSENSLVVNDNADPAVPNFANPRGAASSATSVMIVYDKIEAGGTGIFCKIYNPATDTYGAEIPVMSTASTTVADIAVLTNGNYVIAARQSGADTSIHYRIMNSAGGNVLGNSTVLGTNTNTSTDTDVSVTALTGGGFVLVWTNTDTNDTDVLFRVYDSAGVETSSGSIGDSGATDDNNEPVVIGLADGTFVVIYDNDDASVLSASHHAANGNALGSFNMDADSYGISAVALADGRMAVTYMLDPGDEIQMQILDTRDNANTSGVYTPDGWQVGTVGDDTFTASGNTESVHGWTGNDTITDGFGAEGLFGDDGDDTIIVTSAISVDRFFGGADIDTIDWSGSSQGGAIYDLEAGTAVVGVDSEQMQGFENLTGTANNDTILGTADNNILNGGGGNDTINGRAGIDTLIGGTGNDLFFVDDLADVVGEGAGQGTADRVATNTTYVLAAGVEVEQLQTTSSGGVGAIDLRGNALAQVILGNAGANVLNDGGAGAADTLTGSVGNDTYIVNNAGTLIVEGAGQGSNDRVASSVSFVLAADDNIERLTTSSSGGVGSINLTGNVLIQTITGNAGDNTLHTGGGASDTLIGGAGNDTYRVFTLGDIITETAGNGSADRVTAAVTFTLNADDDIEVMTTNGSAGLSNIALTGNALIQTITGNNGDNRIDGRAGSDTLTGLGGQDDFIFRTATGVSNVDMITDFQTGLDIIELENAIFTGLAGGVLAAAAFRLNNTGQAQDASDRITYDSDDGILYFDADGTGAGGRVQFATLDTGLALTAADIFVV